MPLWDNINFTFGKANTPLRGMSPGTADKLIEPSFNRPQDFVDFDGTYTTADLFRLLLDDDDLARPGSKTRLVNDTICRLNLITPHYSPTGPTKAESACHAWSLDGTPVTEMANSDFVRLVLKVRKNASSPNLPLRQL
ncbi:hypothetical protein JG687_00016122 [Phytophthora cactorum]|uniref:Uncharacterized protein n=1 Tax=Phytophthora cactorum TaxID=29920 RepID=A0A8T1BDI9_9STRA|nr:hypothetical protein PC117_g22683 [Phytophthora cactorum]KAG2978440.1 hypothetical protein PC119_g21754 [Phytophthora cactorum]KAG2993242.1 hypothetical protein PC120_g22294 [Phytophthora cactorum]KAG3045561.1 hypothetical protein PC121_g21194 [Phytophthora cactorum]KAG4041740.1 hypothetical protein PC123_g22753 [Phytophthora cactorum]